MTGMEDCTIILFGITGDLAKRKLIPALYRLIQSGILKNYALIGAALEKTTAESCMNSAQDYIANLDQTVWKELLSRTKYIPVDGRAEKDFIALYDLVNRAEKKYQLSGNRLFYCSTASNFFYPITAHCVRTNLLSRRTTHPWHRIVYEKPFGHDIRSAHEINSHLAKLLDDHQMYRIDHYLTEEMVSNIALVRFSNCVFEPLWNNRYISQVQIILNEELCVGGRGAYYDRYGALKDVVQNHMLELLALIAMDAPATLHGEAIREERAKILQSVRVVDALLGQYDGYTREQYVNPLSTTETFVAAHLAIDNHRWAGVPFYLKTGKCLHAKETSIHIKFKQVDCKLPKEHYHEPNYLTIEVRPHASFALTLNVKKPGFTDTVIPVSMKFCHDLVFKDQRSEPYETLLQEILRGEYAVSVRFDEIEYAWKIVDTISAMGLPLDIYEPGTNGPATIALFEKKHGMRWRA